MNLFARILVMLSLTLLVRVTPVLSYHETLPTHTPIPTPSVSITPEVTQIEAGSRSWFEVEFNDKKTILGLIGLVATGGLVYYLIRPK
jgi:hypothetical protein